MIRRIVLAAGIGTALLSGMTSAKEPLSESEKTLRIVAERVAAACSKKSDEFVAFVDELKRYPALATPERMAHARTHQAYLQICLDAISIKAMLGFIDLGIAP